MWHDEKIIELYNYILSRADYIKYVSENNYTQNCMQKRNEAMVDSCNIVLAVWDGSSGGTCNCVNYARKRNKNIYIINP